MKLNILNSALACAVALAFAGCATTHPSTAWDYKMIRGGLIGMGMPPPLGPQLQKAVAEGWEVVSSGGDSATGFVILRKPKAAGRESKIQQRTPLRVTLKLASVDSEETSGEHGNGENAVDGNPKTFWTTQWLDRSPGLPHEIIIELLPPCAIRGFTYLPRQDESDHGIIKDYEFYVSNDGDEFGQPVKRGSFKPGKEKKTETFEPIKCRFIKLKALSEINGLPWTSAAEIGVIPCGEDAPGQDGS